MQHSPFIKRLFLHSALLSGVQSDLCFCGRLRIVVKELVAALFQNYPYLLL